MRRLALVDCKGRTTNDGSGPWDGRAASAGNKVQPKPAATNWQIVSRLAARKSSFPSSSDAPRPQAASA